MGVAGCDCFKGGEEIRPPTQREDSGRRPLSTAGTMRTDSTGMGMMTMETGDTIGTS